MESSQTLRNLHRHLPYDLGTPTNPWYLVKKNKSLCPYQDFYRNMHCSFICKRLKVETIQILSTGKWIKILCYICRVDNDLSVKRNELLMYTTIGMDLKIIQSERSQTKKEISYYVIPFIWTSGTFKLICGDRKEIRGCLACGCGVSRRKGLPRGTWKLLGRNKFAILTMMMGLHTDLYLCQKLLNYTP